MTFGRGLSRISCLALALAAAPTALVAQSTTTSALTGVVKDHMGRPMGGATVRVTSPALMGERVARTSENGSYRFPLLPPGQYRIVVEAPGQTTLVGKETLELGKASTMNWKFAPPAATTVEVVATVASAETASTSFNQNYSPEKLAALPAERSLEGVMTMTPGVNGKRAWGGVPGENAYMMDGMNVSDPAGGTQYIYPNMDWFSEIQVGGMGAGAEFGGFTGGYINGLIKRGGNELEGGLNAYYGSSKWEARRSYLANPSDLAPAKDWDVVANVGGPIIKDKLWYFASAERVEAQSTAIGALAAEVQSEFKALAKVTWQVRESTTLEFLGEYDNLKREGRGLDAYTLPAATLRQTSPNHSYNLTWTEVLGSNQVFTLKTFGYSGRYDKEPYNGDAMPLDTLEPISVSDFPDADLTGNYKHIEYFNNAQTMEKNYRNRNNLTATLDWFVPGLFTAGDSHAFKFGVEGEALTSEELQRFPGGANLNAEVDSGGPYASYYITGGGWAGKQRGWRMAAFAQDEWKLNERLTLRPGLRFEKFLARFYGDNSYRWNKNTLAPRFGLKYSLTEDQQTILNLHLGRYYAGYSTYFIDRSVQWAIPVKRYYDWGDYEYIDPLLPSTWPVVNPETDNMYREINNLAPVAPNARQPHTNEITASVNHKFKGPWSVAASWVYRDWKDSLVRKDRALEGVNLDSLAETVNNPVTGGTVTIYDTDAYSHDYYIANDSRAKRRYYAISVSAEREMKDHWSLFVSYTRAKAWGNVAKADSYVDVFANPNNTTNAYGLLPGFNDNEIKIRGTYEFPWKMRLSANYTYLSGEHWTPTWTTWRIQEERYSVFAAPRGSETYPGHSLVDIRLSQSIPMARKVNAEVFVDVFNLLNQGNVTENTTRVNASYSNPDSDVYDYYKDPLDGDRGRRARLGLRVTF